MRLRKANRNANRRCRKQRPPPLPETTKLFCYILYSKFVRARTHIVNWITEPYFKHINEPAQYVERKCHRGTFKRAIAYLMALKLDITKENPRYKGFTPCKIVEGGYTKDGKEVIFKETELPNEHPSVPQYVYGGGQPRQQRQRSIPIPKNMGVKRPVVWSDWSTATSSTATGVDFYAKATQIMADQLFGSNITYTN